MNVREMHYDFKQKLNKIDSQSYRNLRVPEIDWMLNEAQMFFVKVIANPKQRYALESSPRSIDDINSLMKRSVMQATAVQSSNRYYAILPSDYMYFVSGECKISKTGCTSRISRLFCKRHIDIHESNTFYESSFEWSEICIEFEKQGTSYKMLLFTDGDYANSGSFTIDEVYVDYLKKPDQIYYGGYTRLDTGQSSETPVQCELPSHVHSDIVDIAVMLATGSLQLPDYQIKMEKVKLINN